MTTTVTELRNELLQVFDALRGGTMSAKAAAEVNNTAGKIINSIKMQLAYSALRGESPHIPFLQGEGEGRLLENEHAR